MRHPLRLLSATLLLLSGTVISACGSTEPMPVAAPHHALAGVYDLSTRLDMFGFETGVPSPPDCPTFSGLYCFHERPFTGASLSGTLTLTDSGSATTLYFAADVNGEFCDTIDLVVGCRHVAPHPMHRLATFYVSGGQKYIPSGPSTDTTTYFVQIIGPGVAPSAEIISLAYHATADSLHGRIYWALASGRDPPHHSGTFVARRRR